MNPVMLLALGAILLLAIGIPAYRVSRAQAAQRRHLQDRLASLRAPAEEIEELTSPRHQAHWLMAHAPRFIRLGLARAGMTLQWRSVILFTIATALLCGLPALFGGAALSGGALVVVLGVALGVFRMVAARRLASFVDGLPLYLDATRQLVMVGNSLQQAMVKAGEGCSPGVARHLAPLLRRVQYGAPSGDSVAWLAERLDIIELHMLAAAIQTNARFGGRISTVLANLTQILRDRARVQRELHSATAETRMSALVLGALPVVVAAFIGATNPSYITFFIDVPQGHKLIAIALGMEVAGVLIMRRIMRIDF
jgi:tight adherence protein B